MNLLEKKYLNDFPPKIKDLFKKLRFKKSFISVVGSSSFKRQKYYGDYDIDNIILKKYSAENAYDEFVKILENILTDDDVFFIEMKLQKLNGDKIKFEKDQKFTFEEFNKYYKDLDFVKIDLVVNYDNLFIELSINYKFNNSKALSDISQSLEESMKSEIKDKNYLKAIKRYLSFLISKGDDADKSKIEMIIDFLNSDVGLKYKVVSNLKALELMGNHYNDDFTMKKMRLNLDNLDRLNLGTQKKLEKDIMLLSKKFLNKII